MSAVPFRGLIKAGYGQWSRPECLPRELLPWLPMLLTALFSWLVPAQEVSAAAALPAMLRSTRLVAYTPRSFSVAGVTVVAATEDGIRADLRLLRPYFDGLLTYSATSGVEAVPAIAHELGFRVVVMGIWDPRSAVEVANVRQAVQRYPSLVAAVAVGNEGLYTRRYQPADVLKTAQQLKKEYPALAVTTSEPFFLYFKEAYAGFFKNFDLLLPNVHPVFEPWFRPEEPRAGVDMILNVAAQFRDAYDLPLLIKETGVPSGPAAGRTGFTPELQARFWAELLGRFPGSDHQTLACFEAFDSPWKPATIGNEFPGDHAAEAFWGFFTAGGEAKPVVKALPPLAPPAAQR